MQDVHDEDDRGEDALDVVSVVVCPIQKEFHGSVENSSSSPNWFKGWEVNSHCIATSGDKRIVPTAAYILTINAATMRLYLGRTCPACAIKIIPF